MAVFKIPPTECPICHGAGTEDDVFLGDALPQDGELVQCLTCHNTLEVVADGLRPWVLPVTFKEGD